MAPTCSRIPTSPASRARSSSSSPRWCARIAAACPKTAFDALPDRLLASARRLSALLRLSVLLHRAHDAEAIPRLDVHAEDIDLTLGLSKRWLDARPLLRADLDSEPMDIAGLGVSVGVLAS